MSGAIPLDRATQQLVQYTLLPKALMPKRDLVRKGLEELIRGQRICCFEDAQSLTVYDLFFTDQTPWAKDRRGSNLHKRSDVIKNVLRTTMRGGNYKETTFSPELAKTIREKLTEAFDADNTFAEDYQIILERLQELERATAERLAAGVTLNQVIEDLNDDSHPSLWVIQSHDPNELRFFSKKLGEELYEHRRQGGIIDPLASFIFDEADEFIRRDASGSHAESAEIAQTLARRGRKFGLGVGIATQRIRYLDTNIMAQPHTYFISKLPRLSDRQAVAEAFGVSEELLNQTFKFKKGHWLLISHDATGLEAVPVPIASPDANDRLAKWLTGRYANNVTVCIPESRPEDQM
jgi:hypothetical protein